MAQYNQKDLDFLKKAKAEGFTYERSIEMLKKAKKAKKETGIEKEVEDGKEDEMGIVGKSAVQIEGLAEGLTSSLATLPTNIGSFGAGLLGFEKASEKLKGYSDTIGGFVEKGGAFDDKAVSSSFGKKTGEFAGDIIGTGKIMKGAKLGAKGFGALTKLKNTSVSKGTLNLMSKYGKGFSTRYPNLAKNVSNIGKGIGVGTAEMAAFGIASEGETKKSELVIGGTIGGAIPGVGILGKGLANTTLGTSVREIAGGTIKRTLGKLGGINDEGVNAIKEIPEILDDAFKGKINFAKLEDRIKNVIPDENLTNRQIDNIKISLIKAAKEASDSSIEKQVVMQDLFEEGVDKIRKDVDLVGQRYQNMPSALEDGTDLISKIKKNIKPLQSKFPSKEEREAIKNISYEINKYDEAIKKGVPVTKGDVITLRRNIKDNIKLETSSKAKRAYLDVADKIDDSLQSVKEYFKLNKEFAPKKQFLDLINKKYVDKTTGEIKDVIGKMKGLVQAKNQKELDIISDVIGIKPNTLKNIINDIEDGISIGKQIPQIEKVTQSKELLNKTMIETNPISSLVNKYSKNLKNIAKREDRYKQLEPLNKILDLNDEDATKAILDLIGKNTTSALKVKEIIRKEIGERGYKELLAMRAFDNISNTVKGGSIASQALNVAVIGSSLGANLGPRNALIISQFIGQPKKMAELLLKWELKTGAKKQSSNIFRKTQIGQELNKEEMSHIMKFITSVGDSMFKDLGITIPKASKIGIIDKAGDEIEDLANNN